MVSKSRPVGKIVAIILGVIVLGAIIVPIVLHKSPQPTIRTAQVKLGSVTSSVSANGILQPFIVVQVKSNAAGQVVQLLVDAGSVVKKGQVIARIDPVTSMTILKEAQADYNGAVAKVQQSQQAETMQRPQDIANIAAAEQSLESARHHLIQAEKTAQIQPALTVASIKQADGNLAETKAALRQLKSALTPQKIAAAQSAYDQAKANIVLAQKNLTRQQALNDKGFVAASTVETAQQQYDVAKAAQDSALKTVQTVKDDAAEDEWQAQAKVDQAQAALTTANINKAQDELRQEDLAAARAAVKQAEAALAVATAGAMQTKMKYQDIVQSQASEDHLQEAVKVAQTQLGYTTVVAPCAGVVVAKYVEVGSIVTAGASSALGSGTGVELVDIADDDPMTVVVNVDETDIAQIRLGQSVDITVDAFPDELYSGVVTKTSPPSRSRSMSPRRIVG
jgi:HlyD family secretion protein